MNLVLWLVLLVALIVVHVHVRRWLVANLTRRLERGPRFIEQEEPKP